jgi:hypothetical protein
VARTLDQIQAELTGRNFPCGLVDLQTVIDAALREFDRTEPLTAFASFNSVIDQQDYFVFDPADPVTKVVDPNNSNAYVALCANALSIVDVFWNPGGDWSSLNLFSPGWQMLSQMVLFTGSYFHQPSQLVILRQKLDTWKRQFGDQGFEVYGEPGDTTAFLRVYPLPKEAGAKIIVQFTKGHTLDTIGRSYERWFQQWIEVYMAEALANYYSQTSGVELLGFKSSADAMKYWHGRYEQLLKRAVDIQQGPQGNVERS